MGRYFKQISLQQFKKDTFLEEGIWQEIKLPKRATARSSGFDFYAPYSFTLDPREEKKIPTGIKAFMQQDEELLIFPRSSIGFKYNVGLCNTIAKIDSDYYNNENNEGHIWLKFVNRGSKIWMVNKGDAIAQGTFYKYLIVDDDEPISEKRKGGIGSTD